MRPCAHWSVEPELVLDGGESPHAKCPLTRGRKRYEGSNHLGNVLVVVSDRKLPIYFVDAGTINGYQADVHAHSDYYPFGMVMEKRTGSAEGYRFGFQGQESDDEVYGAENAMSYKYRVHDPRIGRFLSIDPLAPEYPHNSPYAFSENRVIDHIELEGLESVDPQALESRVMTGIGEGISSFFESLVPTFEGQSSRDPLPQDPGSNGNYDPVKRIYLEEKVGLGLINFGIEADLGVPIELKAEALKVEGGGQLFLEYSDSEGLVIGLDRSTSEVNYGGGVKLAGAYGYEFRNEHSLREHPVFSKDVEKKMTLLSEETIQDRKTTEVKTEIFSLGGEVNLFVTFGLKAAIEVVHERNLGSVSNWLFAASGLLMVSASSEVNNQFHPPPKFRPFG